MSTIQSFTITPLVGGGCRVEVLDELTGAFDSYDSPLGLAAERALIQRTANGPTRVEAGPSGVTVLVEGD